MHKLCTISKCVASHKLGWYDLKSFLGYSGMSTLLPSLCLVTGREMHVDWMLANLASWLLVLTCSWCRGYVILGLWMLHSPWLRTWRAWNATMGRREHTKHSNTSSSNIETPEVTLVYDLLFSCTVAGVESWPSRASKTNYQTRWEWHHNTFCALLPTVSCLFEWTGELFVSYMQKALWL